MMAYTLDIAAAVQGHLTHRVAPDIGSLRQFKGVRRLQALAEAAGIKIVWGGRQPAFEPKSDTVFCPTLVFYIFRHPLRPRRRQKIDLAHEMLHASGAKHRQNRPLITVRGDAYAREELLSETGSALLLVDLELSKRVTICNAKYLKSWLSALPNAGVELDVGIARAAQATAFLLGYARARGVS